ncbi:phosphoglucomutase [Methanomicrobiaceae archaeon CYW5]|uniref:phosphopentomutase/phosphoglucosamine mutase n=1 Tax=Methanovulcanius yangii TaxID=1789227 RepID=UPI0029C9B952|nr:phosphopentomutase/phosphoglucosamine mutase [Methanovulcanius yangii]MBT8507883.1 phosphoglucomutase [Methanovulcanius yangii]
MGLFGSSGIRREFSSSLVEICLRVGQIMGEGAQTVILGRDARTTGPLLAHAFSAGILGSGGCVWDGGVAPTPTVAYATRDASAGAMITASHNPEPYNGIKLFNPDGSSFFLSQQSEIEERIGSGVYPPVTGRGRNDRRDIVTPHMDAILGKISLPSKSRIVLDCGNGAGSVITPRLFGAAGGKCLAVNANVCGRFARPSEPLEENLHHLPSLIRENSATCGIAHDGDADRMMGFDAKGRYISGDMMLMLFAEWLGAKKVVTTFDASMAIEEVAEVQRTPVGDSFVSERLASWGDFGGEPSGSWIFPDHSLCPDGIYAAGLFAMIASEWDVAEWYDTAPQYPVLRDSVRCVDAPAVMKALGAESPTIGLRREQENGWILIRASGTEPKIRLTVEAQEKADAKKYLEIGHSLLREGITKIRKEQ